MTTTKNKTEDKAVQVDLFGKSVSSTELVERRQINLASENPKDTQMQMKIESAYMKHEKNLLLLFGTLDKEDVMLGLFTQHSEKYPSESVPLGKRLGNAVSRKAKWNEPTKTYDDVVNWLNENDNTLTVTHSDKGRLFEIA
tara:strand:+ start:13222 stop:13644 length:423 start_codon:yes stop_codon:yes gene_type:complete